MVSLETERVKLDDTDEKILKILHEDGRASYNDIGERLGITGNTVRRRIEELKKQGIIEKFTVLTNPESLQNLVVAFGLSVEAGKTDEIAETLADHEEIYKLWALSGTHNIIFDSRFKDQTHFQEFVHQSLHNIDGISHYESSIMTRSVADEGSTIVTDDALERYE